MKIESPGAALEKSLSMAEPTTVGRSGHGADVPVGRTDEPNLSATALLITSNVFDEGPPAIGFWTVQHVNPHPLKVEVVADDGPVTVLRYGQQMALPGRCVVRLVLSSAPPVELFVSLPEWERPMAVAASRPIEVVRSGKTGTVGDWLRWPERRRQVIESVWPDLAQGRRPTHKRSSAQVGRLLGIARETVDDHLDVVRNDLKASGADKVGELDRLALGQWMFDHGVLTQEDGR